jgi:hypothetical protein
MTHKQALARLSIMQASSTHSFDERGAPQQLTSCFNNGGVPSGNAHQQMNTLPQHAQVSTNDQMILLCRAIQTQDASHRHQPNMHICQGPQLQNDSGLTLRMSSNPNPLGMDPPQGSQGPGLMQENFPPVRYASVPSSSAPSASQPPPKPHPFNTICDVPLPQLRALYIQLAHIVMEGENCLRSSSEGDIQPHFLIKLQLNKRRLGALQEVIDTKVRAR